MTLEGKDLQIAQLRTELNLLKSGRAADLRRPKHGNAPADIHRDMQLIFSNRKPYRNATSAPPTDKPLPQRLATPFIWRPPEWTPDAPLAGAPRPHTAQVPQWGTLSFNSGRAGLPTHHREQQRSVRLNETHRRPSRDRNWWHREYREARTAAPRGVVWDGATRTGS